MKRLAASILALGLAASIGTASAQSNGYYPQNGTPTPDRYGQSTYGNNAQYDYARVIRVDPVTGSYGNYPTSNSGYGTSNNGYSNGAQRCYQQERNGGYVGNDSYNRDGYYGNDGYQNDGSYGRDDRYANSGGSQTARTVATVVGGIAGAVLGSKVGGGSGSYAASAIGSMVGGMAGRSVYDNTQRQRQREPQGVVTVCDPVSGDGRNYQSGNYSSNNTYNTRNGAAAYDVTYEYGGRRYTTRTNYHPGERIRVRVDVRPE